MKDWNINDSKNSGYIQNRTHWKEVSSKTVTVGGPNCGFHIPGNTADKTIEYIYADANRSNIQLSETITVPIYTSSIIEVMYNKNGEIESYHVQEVTQGSSGYGMVSQIFYEMGIYRSNGGDVDYFLKYSDDIDEEYNELWENLGDIPRDGNLGSWGGNAPTDVQKAIMMEFLDKHAYKMCGGYLGLGRDGTMKLFLPSQTWKEYWGVLDNVADPASYDFGYAIVEEQENGSNCTGPVYTLITQGVNSSSSNSGDAGGTRSASSSLPGVLHFYPIPTSDDIYNYYSETYVTQLSDASTLDGLAAAATCEAIGLDSLVTYHPVTYHTISVEMLSPEIKKMYAWWQNNRTTIQSVIAAAGGNSGDPGFSTVEK